MTEYLTIDQDTYFKAYNDPEIIYNYDVIGNNNLEYLRWGIAYTGLKTYHPSLTPQLEDNFHTVPNLLNDTHLLVSKLNKLLETRTTTKEYKLQRQLDNQINDIENQISYSSRGIILKPYLLCTDTGKRTPSITFPVMDMSNNSCFNPDTRDLNDNIQRAFVKVIAVTTGYGFRIFTRENIGKNLEDSDIVKAIKHIHSLDKYKEQKEELDKIVHLGQDLEVLRNLYKKLVGV